MTKGNKISKATAVKTPETGSESATSNSVPTTQYQDGVMQAAITDFIRNDETVTKAIIDTASNALVTKLLGNKRFIVVEIAGKRCSRRCKTVFSTV